MGTYNRFGATTAGLVAMFPGAASADFGGDTVIGGVLDRTAREVAGALEGKVYHALAEYAELEMVEQFAADGQTTVTLGMLPAVSGTLHIWRMSRLIPVRTKPVWGIYEWPTTSVNYTTGAVVFSTGLAYGDKVFATYRVDCENAAFGWPSVADAVLLGAAAELGGRLYTSGDQQEWALVSQYRAKYAGTVGSVGDDGILRLSRARQWVPDELRRLRWWSEIEPEVNGIGTIDLVRG